MSYSISQLLSELLLAARGIEGGEIENLYLGPW